MPTFQIMFNQMKVMNKILVKKRQERRRAYQQFMLGFLKSVLGFTHFPSSQYCSAQDTIILKKEKRNNAEVREETGCSPDCRQIVKVIWTVNIKLCLNGKDPWLKHIV